jgi:hypothetical protein
MRGDLVEEPVNDLEPPIVGEHRDVEADHERFPISVWRKLPGEARTLW